MEEKRNHEDQQQLEDFNYDADSIATVRGSDLVPSHDYWDSFNESSNTIYKGVRFLLSPEMQEKYKYFQVEATFCNPTDDSSKYQDSTKIGTRGIIFVPYRFQLDYFNYQQLKLKVRGYHRHTIIYDHGLTVFEGDFRLSKKSQLIFCLIQQKTTGWKFSDQIGCFLKEISLNQLQEDSFKNFSLEQKLEDLFDSIRQHNPSNEKRPYMIERATEVLNSNLIAQPSYNQSWTPVIIASYFGFLCLSFSSGEFTVFLKSMKDNNFPTYIFSELKPGIVQSSKIRKYFNEGTKLLLEYSLVINYDLLWLEKIATNEFDDEIWQYLYNRKFTIPIGNKSEINAQYDSSLRNIYDNSVLMNGKRFKIMYQLAPGESSSNRIIQRSALLKLLMADKYLTNKELVDEMKYIITKNTLNFNDLLEVINCVQFATRNNRENKMSTIISEWIVILRKEYFKYLFEISLDDLSQSNKKYANMVVGFKGDLISFLKIDEKIVKDFFDIDIILSEHWSTKLENGLGIILSEPLVNVVISNDSLFLSQACIQWINAMRRKISYDRRNSSMKIIQLLELFTHIIRLVQSVISHINVVEPRFISTISEFVVSHLESEPADTWIRSSRGIFLMFRHDHVLLRTLEPIVLKSLCDAWDKVISVELDDFIYSMNELELNGPEIISTIEQQVFQHILNKFTEIVNKKKLKYQTLSRFNKPIRLFLDSSRFKEIILNHKDMNKIVEFVNNLITSIYSKSITFARIQEMVATTGTASWVDIMYGYASSLNINLTKETLTHMEIKCMEFREEMNATSEYLNTVHDWLSKISHSFLVQLSLFLDHFVNLKSNLPSLSMIDIESSHNVWGKLLVIKNNSTSFSVIKASKLIARVWKETLLEFSCRGSDSLEFDFPSLSSEAFEKTLITINQYLNYLKNPESLSLAAARLIWKDGTSWEHETNAFKKYIISNIEKSDFYCRKYAPALMKTLEVFSCCDDREIVRSSRKLIGISPEISLKELSYIITTWANLLGDDWEMLLPIFLEFSKSSDLVDFIREIKNEKNFDLIDMVEEHSDSFIRLDTAYHFDAARRFIRELLSSETSSSEKWLENLPNVIRTLFRSSRELENIPQMLQVCQLHLNGLKDIWNNVSNREKLTKDLVRQILRSGQSNFSRLNDGNRVEVCIEDGWKSGKIISTENSQQVDISLDNDGQIIKKANISYNISLDNDGQIVKHVSEQMLCPDYSDFSLILSWMNDDGGLENRNVSFIEELRSRALLLVNSMAKDFSHDRDEDQANREKENLQLFIQTAEAAMTISELLSELLLLGHFGYKMSSIDISFKFDALHQIRQELEMEKLKWGDFLQRMRLEYSAVNYFFSHQFWTLDEYFSGRYKSPSTKLKAKILLRFAELDHIDKQLVKSSIRNDNEPYEQFTELAKSLQQIFDSTQPSLDQHQALIGKNSLFACIYDSDRDLLGQYCALYPNGCVRNQMLVCESSTSLEEIKIFIMRCFSVKRSCKLYSIINIHKLSGSNQSLMMKIAVSAIRNKSVENMNQLAMLIRSDGADCVYGMKIPIQIIQPASDSTVSNIFHNLSPFVTVVTSSHSGLGKSHFCKTSSAQHNKNLNTIILSDGMNREDMISWIQCCGVKETDCLHLNLSSITNIYDISIGLLELLVLKTAQFGTNVIKLPKNILCYIEISNSISFNANQLDVTKYFLQHKIKWDSISIASFFINQLDDRIEQDLQVVCNYLDSLEKTQITYREIIFQDLGDRKANAGIIAKSDCQRLMMKYFFDHFQGAFKPSINVFLVFLKVLAYQLKEFSLTPFYWLESLVVSGTNPSIRELIVETLITSCRNFAVKSVSHARDRQNENLTKGQLTDLYDMGVVRWEDDNQLMVAIIDGGLSILYRILNDVNPTLRAWFNSQVDGSTVLKDYFSLSSKELRLRISYFCGLSTCFEGREGYILTADNFLKGVMMLLREMGGFPVIVMGEAGCGKTSLIRMLAAIKNVELEVLNIHAGLKRFDITEKIIAFIIKYENSISNQSKPKKLWIFLDEINTCDDIGFINTIICDRYLSGFSIPSYVSFFAACNPYTKIAKDQTMLNSVGLNLSKKTGVFTIDGLVYRVKPLPDTILDYIWDFGYLRESDELLYIKGIVMDKTIQISDYLNHGQLSLFIDLIAESQDFIRNNFGKCAVSMRDVKRVKILFDWFVNNKNSSQNISLVSIFTAGYLGGDTQRVGYESIILALAHCYRCRMADVDKRISYDQMVSNILVTKVDQSMTVAWIQDVIRVEQE
eukprot:gene9643-12983_t